ncbi:MarR family winged helix-turn-helix transcriptional regulator [Actinomadura viridis]
MSTSIFLLSLARRIETELNALLAPLDLTVSRLGLLGHIAVVPGASFSDLARMSGITVQSAHGAVKALAAAGLVRDRNARAGSASTLEITAEGARLLEAAQRAAAEVDDRMFGADADPVHRQVGDAVRAAFAGRFTS